ncbi:MAG: PriCT-2 domain-containing protein [Achromobacter sp.]|uniref:phage/plasmid primase, P4 family n=1 Tax=Achromobacter sp. TaxID=134375 RepID=UPI001ACA2526|nr:phage/plasmid primase, P4 family [Achromobacter sp.]MBN9642926.1 PriCT-2 domain-containing protein [Achromobacter sp.]
MRAPPSILSPAIADIPAALRAYPARWCVWEAVWSEERTKHTKVPKNPLNVSRNVSSNRGTGWSDFDTAVAGYDVLSLVGEGGLGFRMSEQSSLVGIDLDDCMGPDGELQQWAAEIVARAGSYAELSPSGRGVRIFLKGSIARDWAKPIEVYGGNGGRYLTVTGHRLPDMPADVMQAPEGFFDWLSVTHGPDTIERPERGTAASMQSDLDRTVTLHRVSDETIADVLSAMSAFSVEDADGYAFWAEMGLALKSLAQAGRETQALDMWHAFSGLSPKYDPVEAQRKWEEDLEPQELTYQSIFKWAMDRGWVNPKSAQALKARATADTRLDRTDAGNLALLAELTNGDLRYVTETSSWLFWNEGRWQVDAAGLAAQSQSLRVAEFYYAKGAEMREKASDPTHDDKERKAIAKAADNLDKWAVHCRNRSALVNMQGLAKCDARFAVSILDLDQDPWLFGAENGVVDLRTGQLQDAGRDAFVTRRAPVAFDAGASALRWRQFIDEITSKPDPRASGGYRMRPRLASYLQRALGYSLTGLAREHKMFIAVGEGANGKNVLLDILTWIMGDYCQTIAPEALMAGKGDVDAERPTPSARKLAGARAAISSESKENQRLDVALVKRHTGDGYMTARGLHESPFTFEITHKLWLMTNHRPDLDHVDGAVRGRLHLIPFDRRWNRPGAPTRDPKLADGDKDLVRKLKAEAAGILAWLVAGAMAYNCEGLEPPPEVSDMTNTYFRAQDPVGLWLGEREQCDPKGGSKASALFDDFISWCREEGHDTSGCSNKNAFSARLKREGIAVKKLESGNFYGLRAEEGGFD